jgi:hypothetical protein
MPNVNVGTARIATSVYVPVSSFECGPGPDDDPDDFSPDYDDDATTNIAQPTKAEALAMSKYAYTLDAKGLDFGTWKVSKKDFGLKLKDDQTGYQAALFERTINNVTQYTLAYAGTQDLNKDGLNDEMQLIGLSTSYYEAIEDAEKLSGSVGRTNAIYVGHSMGGGMAIAASMATQSNAITFNPAWVSDATIKNNDLGKPGHIDNYIIRGEILDYLQRQNGDLFGLHEYGNDHFQSSWKTWFGVEGRTWAHLIDNF